MIGLLWFVLAILVSPFRSKARLEAEIAMLRQQLIVLQRKSRGRVRLTEGDRLLFVQLYRWFPSILPILQIVRPETLVRWHRAGFCSYLRWKSRNRGGLVAMPTVQTWLFQEYLPGERRPFRPPRYNARERLSVAEAIGYASLRPIHRGLSYARESSIALLELLHRSPGHRRALAFWSLKGGSLFLEALPG